MKTTAEAIIGQDNLLKFFNKLAVLSGRKAVGGSFIILGPAGAGKKTLANVLIAKLLCQDKPTARPCGECPACVQLKAKVNGDVFWLSLAEDKKNISIEEIRGLLHSLSLSALGQSYKVAVIDQAEKLSHQAANALLKTLEEPSKKTVIVLLATALADLPKTVVSRSQVFALRPLKPELIYDWLVARETKRSQAKILAALSLGWPGLAIKLSDEAAKADHLAAAEVFFNSLEQDLLARQAALDALLNKNLTTEEILNIWQTAARDLLLAKLAQQQWLRYGNLIKDWQNKLNFSLAQVLAWYKSITQAKDYAAANVNPKLVLENIITNL